MHGEQLPCRPAAVPSCAASPSGPAEAEGNHAKPTDHSSPPCRGDQFLCIDPRACAVTSIRHRRGAPVHRSRRHRHHGQRSGRVARLLRRLSELLHGFRRKAGLPLGCCRARRHPGSDPSHYQHPASLGNRSPRSTARPRRGHGGHAVPREARRHRGQKN